nr:hypothetical protein [Tanacetum cinerariifolium]
MYQQQHSPEDNHIEFWKKFIADCSVPNGKKNVMSLCTVTDAIRTTRVFTQRCQTPSLEANNNVLAHSAKDPVDWLIHCYTVAK